MSSSYAVKASAGPRYNPTRRVGSLSIPARLYPPDPLAPPLPHPSGLTNTIDAFQAFLPAAPANHLLVDAPRPLQRLANSPDWERASGRRTRHHVEFGRIPVLTAAGKQKGSIHYTAYTTGERAGGLGRPVTFCFGGGPGASSIFLQLGGVGPAIVQVDSTGGGSLFENYYQSLLLWTDLIFIDPPATGYSSKEPESYGYLQDLHLFADFIQAYLASQGYRPGLFPVNLLGASYGGLRAAGLAHWLLGSVELSNLFLFSPALDYSTFLASPGNEKPYLRFLPTFAATAHFHRKLPPRSQDRPLEALLDEATQFAVDAGEYERLLKKYPATIDPNNLSPADAQELADLETKLWQLTGIPPSVVRTGGWRISNQFFSKFHLLAQLDGRVPFKPGEDASSKIDPYWDAVASLFSAQAPRHFFHQFANRHSIDHDGALFGMGRNEWEGYVAVEPRAEWDWTPFSSIDHADGLDFLAEAMERNPKLQIHAWGGLYDLNTPYSGIDLALNRLPSELHARTSFRAIKSSHAPYLDKDRWEGIAARIGRALSGW